VTSDPWLPFGDDAVPAPQLPGESARAGEGSGRPANTAAAAGAPDFVDDRLPDAASRRAAVDPSRNVVLEASAGTGRRGCSSSAM